MFNMLGASAYSTRMTSSQKPLLLVDMDAFSIPDELIEPRREML